jgi:two-component system OmpR family sensor kinase
MPIRIRLTLWYTFLLGAILVIFSILLYLVLKFSLHAQIDRNLQDRAQQIITSIEDQAIVDLKTRQIFVPQANVFSSPATFIQVIQADGSLVSTSNNLGKQQIPVDDEILANNLKGEPTFKIVMIDNTPLRIYSTPILLGEKVLGAVQVGQSLKEIEDSMRYVLVFLVSGTVGALIVAAIVGAFLARKALHPIEEINQAANHIVSAQDLKRRDHPADRNYQQHASTIR